MAAWGCKLTPVRAETCVNDHWVTCLFPNLFPIIFSFVSMIFFPCAFTEKYLGLETFL